MRYQLACSFVFFAILSFAQESKEPFRRANTIIIKTEHTSEEACKNIAKILVSNGFTIENSNNELLTLSTAAKAFKKGKVKITALAIDNNIRLTGMYLTGVFLDFIPVMYQFGKNSPNMLAWQEMDDIVRQYKDTEIYYSVY